MATLTVAGTVTDREGNVSQAWSASATIGSAFPIGISNGSGNGGGIASWPAWRLYNGSTTAPWPATILSTSTGVQTAINNGAKYVLFSWKNQPTTAQLNALCNSLSALPADVTVDFSYFHEMEDNLTGAVFKPEFSRQRAIVQANATAQARGTKFGPIYQAYTFNPQSGRDYHDWWDSASDFLAVEAYCPGRKDVPPTFDPYPSYLDRVFTALAAEGKPTIVPEFGIPQDPADPNHRSVYLPGVVQYYRDHCPVPVRAILYWDSMVSGGIDNRLDPVSAAALKACNG